MITALTEMDFALLSRLNLPPQNIVDLGTFSTTYMQKEAQKIFHYYAPINAISWPYCHLTEKIKACCSNFMFNLTAGFPVDNYRYFTTSGSSEAIFLAILLFKKYWQSMYFNNKENLNLIIGSNSHVCWQKAANYLDIDVRIIPIDEEQLTMDLTQLFALIDNNTIGLCCTVGAPATLLFDQVQICNTMLEEHYKSTKHFIPIHVDAASGGFIAPFIDNNPSWNFKLNHVLSINLSSHKYGLIYPSLGWLLLHNQLYSEELNREHNYSGESCKTFTIQFSHSAAHLFTQYYYIHEFGYSGYQSIIEELFTLTNVIKHELTQLEEISIISPVNIPHLPGVLFKLNPLKTSMKVQDLSIMLKTKGWKLPAYSLPSPMEHQKVGRIVIRYGFTQELLSKLWNDIKECLTITKTAHF